MAGLIEKGTIVAEGNTLSFAVPGMAAYVQRIHEASQARRLGEFGQPPAQLAIQSTAAPARAVGALALQDPRTGPTQPPAAA